MRIAALAERQHGVVATWQLVATQLGEGAIRYREKVAACTASTAAFTPSATGS